MIELLNAAAVLLLALAPLSAHAQAIQPDRPGIGTDPDVVVPWTLEPEAGTDGFEIRLGIAKGIELDHDRTSWGAKIALPGRAVKTAIKISYDNALGAVVEVPAAIGVSKWFNLGLDAALSRSQQVYAAEFNVTPTGRLTISPAIYHDGKLRAAVFAAWVVRDNLQLDLGYDKRRVAVGMSTSVGIKQLLQHR